MSKNSKRITGEMRIPSSLFKEVGSDVSNLPTLQEKMKKTSGDSISHFLEILLSGASIVKTSDVHIEPSEEKAKIRMRLDGVLHDVFTIDKDLYEKTKSRIKLLSRVKLNIENRPQDGRFTIELPKDDLTIEVRMSSLPSEYGETMVLRLLDPRQLIDFDQLGLREDLYKIFIKEIERPNGMIVVTGPTGSGKTTTLYTFLRKINKPGIKIITIEDPIEYHLENISQTEAEAGTDYDFANGLRAIVRQDPDVILVGEIRDLETAQISIQAALTGHLVFSTLHTNDAAGIITRLQALGEKPVNIAPSINMAIAQRLVRKICKDCADFENASEKDMEEIKKELSSIDEKIFSLPETIKIPKKKGCKVCNYTGYKGRIGIFEALVIDDEMEEIILTSPSTTEIRKKAIEKGMTSMRQDGFIKIIKGETTLEEINRVT